MEEVLFETESSQDRAVIADYLRTVADRLDGGDSLSLSAGEQSIDLEIPDRPVFEVKAERETESGGSELSVEFEIEWKEGESSSESGGDLSIE